MSFDKSKAQKNKKFFAKNDRVKFEDDHKNIDGWGGKTCNKQSYHVTSAATHINSFFRLRSSKTKKRVVKTMRKLHKSMEVGNGVLYNVKMLLSRGGEAKSNRNSSWWPRADGRTEKKFAIQCQVKIFPFSLSLAFSFASRCKFFTFFLLEEGWGRDVVWGKGGGEKKEWCRKKCEQRKREEKNW